VGSCVVIGTLVAQNAESRLRFVAIERLENKANFGSLEKAKSIVSALLGGSALSRIVVSKTKLRQAEVVQLVRLKRETSSPNLGFASRPFVLCGLPVKRPAKGVLLHERRNGQFLLQVTGHPSYGVPWGQDRLVPIFLATLAMRQQKQPSPSAALPRCWMSLDSSKGHPAVV
jgi:hypothetical protein